MEAVIEEWEVMGHLVTKFQGGGKKEQDSTSIKDGIKRRK